jgi:hypothetical protein
MDSQCALIARRVPDRQMIAAVPAVDGLVRERGGGVAASREIRPAENPGGVTDERPGVGRRGVPAPERSADD